jgi:AcrR family transcriptional regulator
MPRTDKRKHIMEAAEKLYTSRRFHEITLELVAEAAEVGKGTIYRYFKDKDDLFLQTALSGFDELCDLIERKVPERAPFPEQLLGACVEISQFFMRRRQLLQMINTEEARMSWSHGEMCERWATQRKKLADTIAKILRKGIEGGALRTDLPAEVLAVYLMGMLRARARDLEDAPESMRTCDVVVDFFLRGAGK